MSRREKDVIVVMLLLVTRRVVRAMVVMLVSLEKRGGTGAANMESPLEKKAKWASH